MSITDPKLRTHVDRVVGLMTSLPEDLRPVCGLLDGWQHFGLVEGAESPRVREPGHSCFQQSCVRRCGGGTRDGAVT